MTRYAAAIALALFLPALLAALRLLPARSWPRRATDALVPWAALPALGCVLLPAEGATLALPWVLLGSEAALTGLTRMFLVPTALIWLAAGHHAHGYLAADPERGRFQGFFLLAMAGNLGVVFARDVPTFYLSFAVMTFSAYALVVHAGTAAARRAGRVYIVLAVLGEAALLAGLMAAAAAADDLAIARLPAAVAAAPGRDWIVALLAVGFGAKAGVLLLHVWLPLAHPVAPTPASAALSGVMIKAGLLGWLQFLPLGAASLPVWGAVFVWMGLAAAFYAVAVGLVQRDPKTVLAYSSISQMGLMTVATGAALASPRHAGVAMTVAAFLALNHGLAKSALFLGVAARDDARVPRWLLSAGVLLPALSLAGASGTGGALAKVALSALDATQLAGLPGALLSASAVATTLLLAKYATLLLDARNAARSSHALPRRCTSAWLITGLAALVLPWAFAPPIATGTLEPHALFDAAWPVVLGAAAWAWWRARATTRTVPAGARAGIPPGDVLALIAPLGEPLARLLRLAGTRPWTLLGAAFDHAQGVWRRRRPGAERAAGVLEARLARKAALVGLGLLLAFGALAT